MEEIELAPCLAAASCIHCSRESLLIYIYDSLGSCISNFYAASKCFAAFLSKIWVVSLHYVCSFVKLYMELVYPIIDYCSVCSSGAWSLKLQWLFNLDLQKSQLGEFPHLGLIANISSPHHAGPSSSTLYQIINLN